jgi:thiol:disulfide interchange protein DsbA
MNKTKKSKAINTQAKGMAVTVIVLVLMIIFAVISIKHSAKGVNNDVPFLDGDHFTTLNKPVSGVLKDNITELFWYGCPHCLSVEPLANEIKVLSISEGWNFEQIHHPASSGVWLFDFNVYAAFKQLGVDGTSGKEYMRAVQSPLNMNRNDLDNFLGDRDIDANEFKLLMQSDDRDQQIKKANLFISDQVNGTPKFIVSGKYLINDLSNAIPIIKYLMKKQP